MGTWGSSLYANDITCDVQDTYLAYLQAQLSNKEAYEKTVEKFFEYINEEEEPLLWYALADTQWKVGRLMPEVKEKALKWIASGGGESLWRDNKKGITRWKKTLKKLKHNLESPMASEKIIQKQIEFDRNPWNVGDVYAYQFHTDIAKKRGFGGKYILFQKIGDSNWYEQPQSIVQVFDKVFDEIPLLSDIDGVRILPLTYPPGYKWMPKSIDDYVPSFDTYLRSSMNYYKKSFYPVKHLTFIGNSPVPAIEYLRTQYSELDWAKDEMDEWLSDYYMQWHGLEY